MIQNTQFRSAFPLGEMDVFDDHISAMAAISTGLPRQVIRLFQNLIAPFGEGHEYTWYAMDGVREMMERW